MNDTMRPAINREKNLYSPDGPSQVTGAELRAARFLLKKKGIQFISANIEVTGLLSYITTTHRNSFRITVKNEDVVLTINQVQDESPNLLLIEEATRDCLRGFEYDSKVKIVRLAYPEITAVVATYIGGGVFAASNDPDNKNSDAFVYFEWPVKQTPFQRMFGWQSRPGVYKLEAMTMRSLYRPKNPYPIELG